MNQRPVEARRELAEGGEAPTGRVYLTPKEAARGECDPEIIFRSAMNMPLRLSKLSRQQPAPGRRRIRVRASTRWTREIRLGTDAVTGAAQQTSTNEMNAVEDEILREIRRGYGRRHAITASAGSLETAPRCLRTSLGNENDRLGSPDIRSRSSNLGFGVVVERRRGPDGQLDLLGGALADGDPVLTTHVGLDRSVDVERPDAQRFERDDAAEGATATSVVPPPMSITMLPMGSWIGSPAPIAAAIGCSSRWVCASPAACGLGTALLDVCVIADGTQISTRAIEPVDAGPLEEQP